MEWNQSQQKQVSQVAQEMGEVIRREVSGRSAPVRVADRNERGRHVWRFRSGTEDTERFLHVAHTAMTSGDDSATKLLEQLNRAKWQDRLFEGPQTSFMLSPRGQLKPWPKQ